MKNEKLTPFKGFLLALFYTALIGFGMYWMHHIAGYVYGDPLMVNTLWWVEILLTILALWGTFKYATWKKIGFGRLNKIHLLWLVIPAVIIILSWARILPGLMHLNHEGLLFLALLGFTTFLVGFSEELMYRGLVLRAFFNKYPVWVSLLVSSVLFSLLHAVNIFGGYPPEAIFSQLLSTLAFGLFAAPLALHLRNIWILVVFHWLWDFLLFSSSLVGIDVPLANLFVLFQFIVIIPLWITVLRKPKSSFMIEEKSTN